MVAWHRSRSADTGLRAIGLLLCVISCLAIAHLIALRPPLPEQAVSAGSLALATIGFLCASAGGAMTCLGGHLFDQVEISALWGTGRLTSVDEAPSRLSASNSARTETGGDLLVKHAA